MAARVLVEIVFPSETVHSLKQAVHERDDDLDGGQGTGIDPANVKAADVLSFWAVGDISPAQNEIITLDELEDIPEPSPEDRSVGAPGTVTPGEAYTQLLSRILERPDGDVVNIVQAAAELPGTMFERLRKAYVEIVGT